MNTNNLYIFLFVFFIILIIAYSFGMGMINLIDSRISKLNNNNINNLNNIQEFFTSAKSSRSTEVIPENNKAETKKLTEHVTPLNNRILETRKETFKTNFDQEFYQNMYKDAKIEGFSNSESEKALQIWEFEKKHKEICQLDHAHGKDRSNINCSYGVTNYADPKDLAAIDLKIFMLNYPTNMTLQDYINWLYCFKDKEDELPYNHLKNLKKLKMGTELVEEAGVLPPPSYYYPPLNAIDYFDKLYNTENEINIAPPINSITSSMLPYNADEYIEFTQNLDVYGSTGELRNDDIGLKKNVNYVNEFVNGQDSFRHKNSAFYNTFRRKKVEI
jgi:hypothetical protein